jgi:transposase
VENAGGLGRYLAMRLAAADESVVDVPPKLSARVRVLSTGNARKNDGLDALATALASIAQRKAGAGRSRGRIRSAAPAFREERGPGGRAYKGAKPPARVPAGSPPRRGDREALGRPGSENLAQHTAQGRHLGVPQTAVGLGDAALRVRTLDRKIADLDGRIEAEIEASGNTLT